MTLVEELRTYVDSVFGDAWVRRDGRKVPEADDLSLKNVAVELDATVLYADLAGSTAMVEQKRDWVAADVYKAYLYCAGKVIRSNGGVITAFDGDRVMAVYLGGTKNSNAAKTALQIRWATDEIVMTRYRQRFPATTFRLRQRVGIDTSKLFVARTGIRGSNDLVWVGNASNHAAKMAALPADFSTYISSDVYVMLQEWAKCGGQERRNMWTDLGTESLGYRLYASNWRWKV